jgi:hypothetical protein
MEILKQLTDILALLPKFAGQFEVVYRILKKIVPVLKNFVTTFDAPQLEAVIAPLERVLVFVEKIAPLVGVKLLLQEQISGQSADLNAQFAPLLERFDELENSVDL